MRVALYSEPFHPSIGGMERFAEDIAWGLRQIGAAPVVVTTTLASDSAADRFSFPVARSAGFATTLDAFRQADVVMLSGLTIAGLAAALLARRRFIVVHHAAYHTPGSIRSAVTGVLKRLVARCTVNVSVSRALAREIGGRHLVIGNAYRDDLFKCHESKRPPRSFLFVGRLVSDKGADLLIDAFAEVAARCPDARLTIVGAGPDADALRARVATLELEQAVRFAGPLSSEQLVAEYNRHAVAVFPSRIEPFGIVALEARACGCELIVSDRGGLPDAAGPAARVVAPAVPALAGAMISAGVNGTASESPAAIAHLRRHHREGVARRYGRLLAIRTKRERLP